MAFFGHKLDDLEDAEIEAGVERIREACRRVGIRSDEAGRAMQELADALAWRAPSSEGYTPVVAPTDPVPPRGGSGTAHPPRGRGRTR